MKTQELLRLCDKLCEKGKLKRNSLEYFSLDFSLEKDLLHHPKDPLLFI